MKIELCEDNGLISNDNIPTLIIVLVTFDDGKQVRIPYEANRTIEQLYKDVRGISFIPPINIPVMPATQIENNKPKNNLSNTICREDIVKCIKLEKDMDGNTNPDLEIGKEYRVIDIYKSNGMVTYYEVLNDNADAKIRISVLPSEVELLRKFVPGLPKRNVKSTALNCECGGIMQFLFFPSDGKFHGHCDACIKQVVIEEEELFSVKK